MRDDPYSRASFAIPAGEFAMGSDEGADDERPAHDVHVDAFYASTHPVTVEQYAEFAHETGHGAPAVRDLPLVVTPAQEIVVSRAGRAVRLARRRAAARARHAIPSRWSPTPTPPPTAAG